MSNIEMLTKEDVVEIHNRLVLDAIESDDPISPPGIKDEGLLESAIGRQNAGYDGKLKYDSPILNAASLCYGICCNHSLHNGNKRTALVSLLCHLDKNGYAFNGRATQGNLYSFMLNVANHSLVPKKKLKNSLDNSDQEVKAMAEWIRKKTRKMQKADRTLSYPELERVLRQHDVHLENHKGNYVDVIKYSTSYETTRWFQKRTVRTREKVANIPFWPGRTVSKNLIKSIRNQAGLTHKDGVDSALFYGTEVTPDDFIVKYRNTLRRLAKT
ncbi:Fic family protein [Sansalvadorimonas sp. 2012CJ34-2]|uniref:Fic family protein n=1 Tax=Parendozoicomonas callyspongiae TaxID=2942213 RepID=A0ABT0PMP1_9GAMM|nr:Fic family protein [Sansalvadorimonas sp. 2012CJ34-2]MCL6272261.1 Fic family protein [Sansalvadorimonas sp. 2012CJ34-2]